MNKKKKQSGKKKLKSYGAQGGVVAAGYESKKYNARESEKNALQQDETRKQNLSSKPGTVETFIDPATGKDTRSPSETYNPVYFGATPDNPKGTGEVSHYDIGTTMGEGTLSTVNTKGIQAPNTPGGAKALQSIQPKPSITTTPQRESQQQNDPNSPLYKKQPENPINTRVKSGQQQEDDLLSLTRKKESDKLTEYGINEQRAGLYDFLYNNKINPSGSVDGRLSLSGLNREQIAQLQKLGLIEDFSGDVQNGYNALLKIGEKEFKSEYDYFRYIREGGDVRDALRKMNQYNKETGSMGQGSTTGGTTPTAPSGMQEGMGMGTGMDENVQGMNDGRANAVYDLMDQGIDDPYEMISYLNYDENGNQIGDFTVREVQQYMQQGNAPLLPDYSADPMEFIQSFGSNSRALRAQGMSLADTKQRLAQDNQESLWTFMEGWEDAKERRERQLEFSEDLEDLQRSREVSSHEKELQLQQLDQKRAEAIARDQAEDDEMVARRSAARLGINYDGGGVKWTQDIVRKSNEHLSYIIQRGGIESASMVREHENNMKAIDYDAQIRYDQIWDNYESSVAGIKKERLMDKKAIRDAEQAAEQEYLNKLWEVDKWKGEQYLTEVRRSEDRAWESYKFERQQKIADAQSRAQTSKDRIEFARDTYSLITNSQAYKDYDEVRTRATQARETFSLYKQGYVDRSLMANALTKSFEKILDPTSVVREGEFQMTEKLQSYFTPQGWQGLKEKLSGGGTAVPDEVFQDLVNLSEAFARVQLKRVQQQSAPLLEQASEYNGLLGDNPMSLDMLVPDGMPVGDWDSYGQYASEYYGGNQMGADAGNVPTFDYNATDDLPPVNSYVQTTIGAGTITGYGSAASGAGLDLAGEPNSVLRAPMGGTIVEVTYDPSWRGNPFTDEKDFSANKSQNSAKYQQQKSQNGGYGNSVVMKLDNGQTVRLSHLANTIDPSKKGQRVEFGTELGRLGNTGMTYGRTGYHVDIEMENENGQKMTPQQVAAFIGAGSAAPTMRGGNTMFETAYAADYPSANTPAPQQAPNSSYQSKAPQQVKLPPNENRQINEIMASLQQPEVFASGMLAQKALELQGKISKKAVGVLSNALKQYFSGVQQNQTAFNSGYQSR